MQHAANNCSLKHMSLPAIQCTTLCTCPTHSAVHSHCAPAPPTLLSTHTVHLPHPLCCPLTPYNPPQHPHTLGRLGLALARTHARTHALLERDYLCAHSPRGVGGTIQAMCLKKGDSANGARPSSALDSGAVCVVH